MTSGNPLNQFRKWLPRRVSEEEILIFTRQFQTLFKAGLGMEVILSTLSRQSQNKVFREILEEVRNDVSGGATLSKAFSKHPTIFREYYVNMLAAGEEAGILDETLKYLGDLLEKEYGIKASVKSATLYPKIVVFFLIAATTVLMTVVVPKFASFYGRYKAELPLPTKVMMMTSQLFTHYWYALALVSGAGWIAYRRFRKSYRGQLKLGQFSFKVPVFGPLNLRAVNARFCHILAALYRSGLPITRSLEITGATIENGAFRRDVEVVRADVMPGRSISQALGACHYFTPVTVEAVEAGEKAGSLDEMLESVGNHYDSEVSHTIKNLSTLLEPFLLVLIFAMVTLFALAIFLPIWNMSKVVSG